MEDKLEMPRPLSKKELLLREFEQVKREKKISRTRAAVVRNQILRAYEILENIRFDYVSDTAFRDCIVSSKKHLEAAIDDFLMSDKYWEDRVDFFTKMTIEDYKKWKKRPVVQQSGKIK